MALFRFRCPGPFGVNQSNKMGFNSENYRVTNPGLRVSLVGLSCQCHWQAPVLGGTAPSESITGKLKLPSTVRGPLCRRRLAADISKVGSAYKCKICIYGRLHMLHIKLHISAYFHCIFLAYLTNTVYVFAYFFAYFLHIIGYTCIF